MFLNIKFLEYSEVRLRAKLGDNAITRGNWGDAKSREPERFVMQKLQCSPGSLSVLDPDLYEVGPDRVKKFANYNDAFVAAGVDATLLKYGPVQAIVEWIKRQIGARRTLYDSSQPDSCSFLRHGSQDKWDFSACAKIPLG